MSRARVSCNPDNSSNLITMRLFTTRAAVAALTVLLSACASGGAKKEETYVAATNQTVLLEQETLQGRAQARAAYLVNRSTVPVIVTGLNITQCVNIKQYCGTTKLAIKVGPGQRRQILRIEPDNFATAFNYRMSYTWRAEGSTKAVLTAMADAGDGASAGRLVAANHAEAMNKDFLRYNDKVLTAADLRLLGNTFAGLRADPDTVQMSVGQVMFVPQLRTLAVDANGRVLGRVRAAMTWRIHVNTAIVFAPPDTLRAVQAGSTEVTISLGRTVLQDSLPARTIAPITFTVIAR